jgi:hypothetical protein
MTLFRGLVLAAVVTTAWAHMQLFSPPPFRAANNPYTIGDPDTTLDFPHNCCGKVTPMPCRGYLSLLGTPEGAAVASWPLGSKQTWSLTGPREYFENPVNKQLTGLQSLMEEITTGEAVRLASPLTKAPLSEQPSLTPEIAPYVLAERIPLVNNFHSTFLRIYLWANRSLHGLG